MTAAATVQDVTMRFREHTALDGVSTDVRARQHHRAARPQRRRQDDPHAAAHRPASRRPRAASRCSAARPYENDAVLGRICFIKEGQRYPDHFRVCDALRRRRAAVPRLGRRPSPRSLLRGLRAAGQAAGQEAVPRHDAPRSASSSASPPGPPVTLFDEPYLGLDAVARQLFYDRLLADYAEHPRTVVLSTHLIEEVGEPARARRC